MMINIKNKQEIVAMREGGAMLATVLRYLRRHTTDGLSPRDMAVMAKRELKALGGEPAFLGVPGNPDFPSVICISVNDQVQHSIPTNKPLRAGDIVNYDFGVRHKGLITDAGITVCVDDKFNEDTRRLVNGTERALSEGLNAVKDGARVGDISAAIEKVLVNNKLGIVQELVGHGVGHELHEEPEIPNYGRAGTGAILRSGMTIAVEPITTLGDHSIVQDDDGWTLRTLDGSLSAQFEHTVLVTNDGCEILTVQAD